MSIPTSCLRTIIHTVPKDISKTLSPVSTLSPITVHGLLAAELALTTTPSPWKAVLPTAQDFLHVPLTWDLALQALLPSKAAALLKLQKSKLFQDWTIVSRAFPSISYDEYLYNWLVVNTRTFYFLSRSHVTKGKAKNTPPRDDCLALNPFADYINHTSDPSCYASLTPLGYNVIASSPVAKDIEITISYGSHSNDFLLAEYGFILEENVWDEIVLDDYIIPLVDEKKKEQLRELGFWGNYVLDSRTVCHRTEVVVRAICLPFGRWKLFALGLDDGEKHQSLVNERLLQTIQSYKKEAVERKAQIAVVVEGLESQRAALIKRYTQIIILLEAAMDRIQS